jgi:hypothetical protein
MSHVSNTDLSVNDKDSFSKEFAWGALNIGRVIGRSRRQTYHMLRRGLIKSARQSGRNYCAHIPTLRKEFGAE